MKCNQCGKSVNHPCDRDDCGLQASIAAADKLARIATSDERERNLARHHFRDNFDAVAAWSEAKGWTKPDQRGTNFRAASETDRGKIVIAAIARSL